MRHGGCSEARRRGATEICDQMAGGGRLGSHESQDRGKKVLRCEGKTERNPVAVSTWSTAKGSHPTCIDGESSGIDMVSSSLRTPS